MKFRKLLLQTNQLEGLHGFYSSLLELTGRREGDSRVSMAIGTTDLIFQEVKKSSAFYHFAINIPANKIEEARLWLKSKVDLLWINDYNSEIADFKNWHAKSVYFLDPAGNIVELISRFDLKDAVDEKFSSKHLNCISEIGIVFKENEFDRRAAELLEKFGLNYFIKQPPLKQFRAIGDDEGLFIVVPENRYWYPTKKWAGIFPMEIEFEEKGRCFLIKF